MPASASPRATSTAWRRALADVLDGRGVETVYQPIVDLHRGVVTGYEALSRFRHPEVDGGPDAWFAAAWETGLAAELDAVAVRSALAGRPALPANCFLTVNVEPASLLSGAVSAAFAAAGGLGGVVVEITEHRPVDLLEIEPALDRLRGDGALIAVDDAGAGYAGLTWLLALRPSILKLDRALVQGIDRDEAKAALVEMLGVFSNRIDAWVLAEGIETEAELLRLVDLGVPLGQGYFLATPAVPWATVDPRVRELLESRAEASDLPLLPLVARAPTVRQGDDVAAVLAVEDAAWLVVLDPDDRPVGLVTPAAVLAGEMLPALRVSAASTPAEVAHRLSTGGGDPATPALVVDRTGRYLGIVTLRRLLSELARDASRAAGATAASS